MTDAHLVLLDVDGTLLDHGQNLSDAVAGSVVAARRAGHLVFLCTGRSRREIPSALTDVGFDGVVSAGGGFVDHGDRALVARTMDDAAVAELTSVFAEHDVEYALQAYDELYPSEGLLDRVLPLFWRFARASRTVRSDEELRALQEPLRHRGAPPAGTGIAKATFFGADVGTLARMREALGDRYHVITGTIPYLGENGGEVAPHGVHKGAAATELAAALGIPLSRTIGIGDSDNDLEMLDVCGVGIAMGQAADHVKARADEVTASVDEDGVAVALSRHGLA
ncbi:Cof-type HAD-IIB family hydrolase [Pseudokineococcus sp. 1T1Z-3]|uniref:Cof-type HAD-IIB family hydrolase n=1 Tax=Pseudokineococcus sp. 1T1Z-3 TaxID=3132745 RepID=UPI00309EC45D